MPTRRAVLLGAGVALGTAACSGSKSSGAAAAPPATTSSTTTTHSASASPSATSASPTPSPTPTPTPSPSTSPSPTPTPTPAWTPNPGDIDPDIKATAVQYVINYVKQPTLQVFEAQYGGLLSASSSVLVVTSAGTFDVRLVQASPHWTVTAINPSEPGSAAKTLSTAAQRVLANSRIHLPPAGAADVRSGNVHDTVLQTLQTLSDEHELTVSVVRSGHPIYVFGTNRLSDHPRGRAVDVWLIDGHPVVDPSTSTSLVDGLMRRAAALGAYNVGGPRQLSGSQFFSDQTHHDHVHIGFLT